MKGERLSQFVSFEALKLAAGLVLLSPFVPLIFMGEEYGETAPFPYFVSHSEPELVEAVRRGRQQEFAAFHWQGDLPDPQDEATFLSAKLNHNLNKEGHHRVLLDLYKELIRLRRGTPALSHLSKETMKVRDFADGKLLSLRRWSENSEVSVIFNFNKEDTTAEVPFPTGYWQKRLDSSEERWQGKGSMVPERLDSGSGEETYITFSPWAFVLFIKET